MAFVIEDKPELESVEFRHRAACISATLSRTAKDTENRFGWTAVPKAFSLFVLDYMISRKSTPPRQFAFRQIGEKNPAKSLGDAVNQHAGFLAKLFKRTAKTLLEVTQDKATGRPETIRPSANFPEPDCITVIWGDRREIASRDDLSDLAKRIRFSMGLIQDDVTPRGSSVPAQESHFDEAAYARAICNRYEQLPVEILDAGDGSYRRFSLCKLYVPPEVRVCQEYLPRVLEAPTSYFQQPQQDDRSQIVCSPSGDEGTLRRQYLRQLPGSAISIIDEPLNQRLVVLGSLGAGKSSLLQFMALRWANANPAQRKNLEVPLVIELRIYAGYADARRRQGQSHDFTGFLSEGSGAFHHFSAEILEELLAKGRSIALFDGLDEVLDISLRQEVLTSLIRFSVRYPQARLVLTSRLVGYQGDMLRQAGFQHVMLQDFNENQIVSLLDNWQLILGDKIEGRPGEEMDALKRAIDESPLLRELAGNPFLLTMMAVTEGTGSRARNRAELFQRFTAMLLERWKIDETMRADPDLVADATALGVAEKSRILRRLAVRIRTESPEFENTVSAEVLENVIATSIKGLVRSNRLSVARAMVRHFRERTGVLCRAGHGHFAFVHRGLLEYFCADDLRDRFAKDFMDTKNSKAVFALHWQDKSWHQVLILLCGMVERKQVELLLNDVLDDCGEWHRDEGVLFAASCLKEVIQREQIGVLVSRIEKELLIISGYGEPDSKSRTSCAPGTPREIEEYSWDLEVEAWNGENLRREANAEQAVMLLASVSAGVVDVGRHLQRLVDSSPFYSVQKTAIEALARGWRNLPEIHSWLQNCAQDAKSFGCRKAALNGLGRFYREHPSTLDLLKRRAELDEDSGVREAAIMVIAHGWNRDRRVEQWLKRQVSKGKMLDTRAAAVEGVARYYSSKGSILSWLKGIVRNSPDERVRGTAVREIGRLRMESSSLFEWIYALASSDKSGEVRSAAVSLLQDRFPKNPKTLQLFPRLLRKDKDVWVRQNALSGLIKHWRDQPITRALIKFSAQQVKDWGVPNIAITALAEYWKDDPDTLKLIKSAHKNGDLSLRMDAADLLLEHWGIEVEMAPCSPSDGRGKGGQ